jgi:hypothetical protein
MKRRIQIALISIAFLLSIVALPVAEAHTVSTLLHPSETPTYVGDSVYDTATYALGNYCNPPTISCHNTLTFYYYFSSMPLSNPTCPPPVGGSITLVKYDTITGLGSSGSANAISVTLSSAGYYYFYSTYNEAHSGCEPLTVLTKVFTPVFPFGDILALVAPLGALLAYALIASRNSRAVKL